MGADHLFAMIAGITNKVIFEQRGHGRIWITRWRKVGQENLSCSEKRYQIPMTWNVWVVGRSFFSKILWSSPGM
jgi:hypothetical protein